MMIRYEIIIAYNNVEKRMKKSAIGVVVMFCVLIMNGVVHGFSAADLARLKATNQCPNCDLTGTILDGAELSRATWTDGRICYSGSVGICKH
ncbi:MAG: hypothetical protein HQL09_08210 [Nitrospirae bacterium]|nr:hypothetical protein [Nitrospirota bacterium]